MLAQAQTTEPTTERAQTIAAAKRALKAAEQPKPTKPINDPIPAKAAKSASRAVLRMEQARTERRLVQPDWKRRPADWRPFETWDEAHAAWCAARQAWSDAFSAVRNISTPFIHGGTTQAWLVNAYVFSRTIDEALAKAPDLPANLIEASRAEEAARAHKEHTRRRATQTPATGLDILAKMRLITEPIDDVFDPFEPEDIREAHKRPDTFPQANEFFALHDDIVRAVTPAEGPRLVAGTQSGPEQKVRLQWLEALTGYQAAVAEVKTIKAAVDAARSGMDAAAPIPAILQLGPGRWYFREEHIQRDVRQPHPGNKTLTIEEAAAKLTALREFLPVYEAANASHRVEELEAEYDESSERVLHAAEGLINTPAPDAAAAALKLTVVLKEWLGITEAADGDEALTDENPEPWAMVRVAQDLLRLTGGASPLMESQPFDAVGFISTFEALPGHSITPPGLDRGVTSRGGPQFDHPEAWPGLMDEPTYNAHFTVKDEAVISQWCDAVGASDKNRELYLQGGIFTPDTLAEMYPNEPERIAKLRELEADQTRIRKQKPAGHHLWNDLTEWQQEAVRRAAKVRARKAGQ